MDSGERWQEAAISNILSVARAPGIVLILLQYTISYNRAIIVMKAQQPQPAGQCFLFRFGLPSFINKIEIEKSGKYLPGWRKFQLRGMISLQNRGLFQVLGLFEGRKVADSPRPKPMFF